MVSGLASARDVASRRFVSEACRRRVLAHVRVFTVHGRSVLILACHVLVLVCMCSYTILGRRMRIPCSGSALEDEKRPILRSPCDRRASQHRTREGRPHAIIVKISTRCIKVRLVLSSLLAIQTLQLTNEHTN